MLIRILELLKHLELLWAQLQDPVRISSDGPDPQKLTLTVRGGHAWIVAVLTGALLATKVIVAVRSHVDVVLILILVLILGSGRRGEASGPMVVLALVAAVPVVAVGTGVQQVGGREGGGGGGGGGGRGGGRRRSHVEHLKQTTIQFFKVLAPNFYLSVCIFTGCGSVYASGRQQFSFKVKAASPFFTIM